MYIVKRYIIPRNRNFLSPVASRYYSAKKPDADPEFRTGTIIVENNLNLQELPVIIRKAKDLAFISNDNVPVVSEIITQQDNNSFNVIKAEFIGCSDLRDVFSLLSKCIKITPKIALAAVERISELEKAPKLTDALDMSIVHVYSARDAILDKLLKVIIQTEDNKILLAVLGVSSSFLDPYKYKFSDELLVRATENKLSIEELCDFVSYLAKNKINIRYAVTIDKLWVGFVEKECAINENNIDLIFNVLQNFKSSKKTLLSLLEKKFADLWYKISVSTMQEITNVVSRNIHLSEQSFNFVGRWFNTNIHILDEDSMIYFVTTFTKLDYTDDQIQKAIERYIKMRNIKIKSELLIISILNHCIHFNIVNKNILNGCSDFFMINSSAVSHTLLKSFIFPFGYLHFIPSNPKFWSTVEENVLDQFNKININDILSIILAFIYVGKYPLQLVNTVFTPQIMRQCNSFEEKENLCLIDTALSIECAAYSGPFLPKDQWSQTISQDNRIKNLICSVKDTLDLIAGGSEKVSTPVLVPHMLAHETYLVDVMFYPDGVSKNNFNWKLKLDGNVALLIHLPEHYCYDTDQLIGPQILRKKQLNLLGLNVVSLNYSTICKLKSDKKQLEKYISDNLKNTAFCII